MLDMAAVPAQYSTMNTNIHKLCQRCIKKCKQPDTIKIVRCPKYEKAPTVKDMNEIIQIMDDTDQKINELLTRIKRLRKKMGREPEPEE